MHGIGGVIELVGATIKFVCAEHFYGQNEHNSMCDYQLIRWCYKGGIELVSA